MERPQGTNVGSSSIRKLAGVIKIESFSKKPEKRLD
jgi:hypothetical protein